MAGCPAAPSQRPGALGPDPRPAVAACLPGPRGPSPGHPDVLAPAELSSRTIQAPDAVAPRAMPVSIIRPLRPPGARGARDRAFPGPAAPKSPRASPRPRRASTPRLPADGRDGPSPIRAGPDAPADTGGRSRLGAGRGGARTAPQNRWVASACAASRVTEGAQTSPRASWTRPRAAPGCGPPGSPAAHELKTLGAAPASRPPEGAVEASGRPHRASAARRDPDPIRRARARCRRRRSTARTTTCAIGHQATATGAAHARCRDPGFADAPACPKRRRR